MRSRRTLLVAAAATVIAAGLLPAAADDGPNRLTWSKPSIGFEGGPLVGAYRRGSCLPTSCAKIQVTVDDSAARRWQRDTGGLVVSIAWPDPNQELDLFVYDAKGTELDMANFGGVTSQRVFVANPPAGTYDILVQSFSGAGATFTGTAQLDLQNAPVIRTVPSTMRFSPTALVDPQLTTGEPGIRLAPNGQAFAHAPWHASTTTSFVWRSQPREGNLTYRLLDGFIAAGVSEPRHRACAGSSGGADNDVAVGRDGNVLVADAALATVGVSRSSDNGRTWECSAVSSTVPDDDRPWIAMAPTADGTGPATDAYLAYRAMSLSGQFATGATDMPVRLQIDRTTDAGRTWQGVAGVGDGRQRIQGAPVYMKEPGQVFTDHRNGMFVPFSAPGGRVYLARSLDGGKHVDVQLVSQRLGTPAYAFVAGAADRAGNIYIAWVDLGTFALVYTRSTDRGRSWSAPQRINPMGTTAVFPWVAAGAGGDLAIGWYGTAEAVRPDLQPATAKWFPYVARTLGADRAHPVFQRAAMTSTPIHIGPLCVADTPCDPATRRFGDFFQLDIDRTGALRAAFNDDAGAVSAYIVTATQTGGLGTKRRLHVAETRRDATYAAGGATAAYFPQLDFTALPKVSSTNTGLRLTMPVASTDDPAAALAAYDAGAGTVATWLATWRNSDGQLRFAAAQADPTGAIGFFGGTTPGNATMGPDSGYATYADGTPAGATPVTGRFGPNGAITLNLPRWLTTGADFSSLQAFALVGVPQRGQPMPLELIDSTPPRL
jgi:hypothetical protein